jgi:copper homeostasis protein
VLLEVIVQTLAEARAAEAGGADRLEVVREIERNGLTPSLDIVRAIASETRVPLRAMVRESDGFELTGPDELVVLQRAIAAFAELGVDGAVIGFARAGALDLEAIDAVLSTAPMLPITLHRAFDSVNDPVGSIRIVRRRRQIDRILTAGSPGNWATRCYRLREYVAVAAPELTILAGGGLDEAGLRELTAAACVSEAHIGRAARVDGLRAAPVDADRVRRLKSIAAGY